MKAQQVADVDRIVRIAELTEILGSSKTTVWRMRRRRELPPPLRISAGVVGWKLSVINALLDKWEREAEAAAAGDGDEDEIEDEDAEEEAFQREARRRERRVIRTRPERKR